MSKPIDYSLADFHYNDNPNILAPPDDFTEWLTHPEIRWGMSFFEEALSGAPTPRTRLRDNRTGQERDVINMTSYNYLGLSTHPEVIAAAVEALQTYGLGASGSPRLSGYLMLHDELNRKLAELKKKEACHVYPAGVLGNIGAMTAILRKDDVLVFDSLAHQSILDGGMMAKCKMRQFAHNDANSLEDVLKKGKEKGLRQLVVIEGVYSMEGDLGNLPEVADVCERMGAGLYLDEAHSTLMFGSRGGGIADHFGLEDKVGVSYGTFSKSFGAQGGFVCSDTALNLYMRSYSTAYNFSCALAPALTAGVLKSLDVATRDSSLRDKLWENTAYFRGHLERMGLDLGVCASQVLTIILGVERLKLYTYAEQMRNRGLFIQPVDYPAVPADATRFRLSMSAQYTRQDMDEALTIIEDVLVKGVSDKTVVTVG